MAMKCPECGADSIVIETRTKKTENITRRVYECFGCPKTKTTHKFNTFEHVVPTSVRIKTKT